jgi:L,D-transpeptidase catalytic domain
MSQIGPRWCRSLVFAVWGLVCLTAAPVALNIGGASAKSGREGRHDHQLRVADKPVLAIVSLRDQRISIYNAGGKFLEAPVSTGSAGYETPAGIFSIVQKKEMHSSNLYEDGEMPFMQRLTWTGIALHAGVLPGRPASHGCIRLPMAFAQQLFQLTDLGMRVLIVRDDMGPSDISHPALFKSKPVGKEPTSAFRGDPSFSSKAASEARLGGSEPSRGFAPGSDAYRQMLQAEISSRTIELESAINRLRAARAALTRATSEEAASTRQLRAQEANFGKAEAALKEVERRIETSTETQIRVRAEAAKAKALARLEELQTQLQTARLQAQAKRDVAERAAEEARAAAAAKDSAADAAEGATRKTLPVSVFISRKTQRVYVRKGNYPIYEGPADVRAAHMPIGTFVFTAVEPLGTSGDMRWSVVAMYRNPTAIEPVSQARTGAAAPTDVAAAKAALSRIDFGQEALDIISEVVWLGSSLIISDEGPSRETGKDTDFVVVMSGEPQGALKIRQREPRPLDWFEQAPFRGLRSFWN